MHMYGSNFRKGQANVGQKIIDDKQYTGLAGEYAVASELCRRGCYAQLTLGNHKKTDLLVERKGKLFCVSVKAKKKSYTWPRVKGIEKGDILVFVDFQKKAADERPDFYILNVGNWVKLIEKNENSRRTKVAKLIKKQIHCIGNHGRDIPKAGRVAP